MNKFKWLERYAEAITAPTHGCAVSSNVEDFLSRKKLSTRVWLRAKRDLVMFCTMQLGLVKTHIPVASKRILYVYLGNPNLGDSIMDLSARALWAEQGLQVDMYTNAVIASLYKNDPSFNRIISDPKELATDYDFIVLQSYSWKCLKFKWRHYLLKPYVSLYGHYYGCEFNRLDFAEAAWRNIMRLPKGNANKSCPVIFKLNIGSSRRGCSAFASNKIALAIGGIVDWRTYPNWGDVISRVHQRFHGLEWVLVGSENGVAAAELIVKDHHNNIMIKNLVCQLSLDDVFNELQNVTMLIAADGGLMNMGRAANIPIVALFAREIHPRMRFAERDAVRAIYAQRSVAEIPPDAIAEAILSNLDNSPKMLIAEYLGPEPECS